MKYAGKDYSTPENAASYDAKMSSLRDTRKENEEILKSLRISDGDVVVDMGCGTGEFVAFIAGFCRKAVGVDVSGTMLGIAQRKARMQNASNAEFVRAGFLTYSHPGEKVDAIVSQMALHHLPDFWKSVALRRMHSMLKDGGRLYLKDIAYSFPVDDHPAAFDALLGKVKALGIEQFTRDIELSISSEFVTFAWILEELLRKAGFCIDEKKSHMGFAASYTCRKL